MDRMNGVRDLLLRIFREELGDSTLDERVSTKTCPAWDSLGHIRLLIAIEHAFGFELSSEDVAAMYSDFPTVEQLIADKSR